MTILADRQHQKGGIICAELYHKRTKLQQATSAEFYVIFVLFVETGCQQVDSVTQLSVVTAGLNQNIEETKHRHVCHQNSLTEISVTFVTYNLCRIFVFLAEFPCRSSSSYVVIGIQQNQKLISSIVSYRIVISVILLGRTKS